MPEVASIPVLAARTSMSDSTASSCAATIAGEIAKKSRTPRVFCAVTAVTTSVPNTPRAQKVRRSAARPAPPPESLPAMVRATFGVELICVGTTGRHESRRRSYGQGVGTVFLGPGPCRSRGRYRLMWEAIGVRTPGRGNKSQ